MSDIWISNFTSPPNFDTFGRQGDITEIYGNEKDIPFEIFSISTENGTSSFQNSTSISNSVPAKFLEMSPNSRNCVIAYIFLFIIAATGNFSVFFSVLQQLRRTKSRISVFILHLSVADLLVTFGVIPLEVIWRITVQWYGGNILCKICKFFSAFGLYLSSMVLICISLDRYFAIIHPLRVTDARRRGRLMLGSAWITATICSLPQMLIFHVESHPNYPSFQQCVSLGFFSSAGEELIYNVFSVSFMYFVPLTIVIFTYVMILCKISRKSRQHKESRKQADEVGGRILLRRSDASNHMERAKSRTLKLTIVIVIVFVVCWTPYVVMTLWYMLDRESAEKVDGKIQDALFIMVVSNSCLNPLVYGTYTRECRESMTNCCGYMKGNSETRRDIRTRRRNGTGGLRRQSQLKMIYTSSKRSTCKVPIESIRTIPLNTVIPHVQEPTKPLSYRMGYSNSSVPTSIATLVDCSPNISPSQLSGGQVGFFHDSNGSQRLRHHNLSSGRNNHFHSPLPPLRPCSQNSLILPGGNDIVIQEENELSPLENKSLVKLNEYQLSTNYSSNLNDKSNNSITFSTFNKTNNDSPDPHDSSTTYSITISPTTVICSIENDKLNNSVPVD